jgi:hypothetical protein
MLCKSDAYRVATKICKSHAYRPGPFLQIRRSDAVRSRRAILLRMAKKTTLNELGDMLEFAVNRMATKDDIRGIVREEIMPFRTELKGEIAALGEQATNVERELRVTRRDLGDLTRKVENVIGFRKEIDHALERIAAIEKHLGLDNKIAA